MEKKHNADEKSRKAAEQEAAKVRKEEAKAKRDEERASKTKLVTTIATFSGIKHASPRDCCPTKKKTHLDGVAIDVNPDADHSCVCLGSHNEDIDTVREWVQCSCLKWLHEDCVDNEDIDSNGRLCPLC